MPSKKLTARVDFDTTAAHRKLDKLITKIDKINKFVNKNTNAKGLDKQLEKAILQQDKLKRSTLQTQAAEERLNAAKNRTAATAQRLEAATIRTTSAELRLQQQVAKTNAAKEQASRKVTTINDKIRGWASNHTRIEDGIRRINSGYKKTGSLLSMMGGKLLGILNTYLGIMGVKALVNISDIVTSAENKLNYVSAKQLGSSGYTTDGNGYSQATFNATEDAMDKMYASSQKVRMSYTDMMSNVSKSMTLAGDSFQNSTDNAIRFQEIMAEAYAIGGASQQEMSSSMYQMIQALGAGVLAGDELRSVREGAPLAYQAIEEFAQKVYDTEESLKDLASQGKITSEMVVEAIMDYGGEMDKVFSMTQQTFAQTWEQIKNAAQYAFAPFARMVRDTLNDAIDNGLTEKIEKFFVVVSKALQILFKVIQKAVQWVVDNWNWLKYVVAGVIFVIIGLLAKMAAISIANAVVTAAAWLVAHLPLVIIAATIAYIIYLFSKWREGAITTAELILNACAVIVVALLVIGLLTESTILIAMAGIIALAALIFIYLEEICGAVFVAGAFIKNIALSIANFFIACWEAIKVGAHNRIAFMVNTTLGLWEAIKAIGQNIRIAFENAWNGALSAFWNFIADCVSGLDWLSKPLNAIAKLFGKSFDAEVFGENLRAKADSYKQQDYVSVGDAFKSGAIMEYESVGDAWKSGLNTYDTWGEGWASNAYDAGYNWGADAKSSIVDWGEGLLNKVNGKVSNAGGIFDNLGEKFGLNFDDSFPNASNPANSVADAFKPSEDLLKGIGDDTSAISDSMDLTAEDLKYLRDVANMEWKKEFTTANIIVDMKNNNTINNQGDLDGWAVRLKDVLEEELNNASDGWHSSYSLVGA